MILPVPPLRKSQASGSGCLLASIDFAVRGSVVLTRRLRPASPTNVNSESFRRCEGFRMPADRDGCGRHVGRRSKACREGTRERCAARAPRGLWGFGRGGSGGGDGIEVWALLMVAVGEGI